VLSGGNAGLNDGKQRLGKPSKETLDPITGTQAEVRAKQRKVPLAAYCRWRSPLVSPRAMHAAKPEATDFATPAMYDNGPTGSRVLAQATTCELPILLILLTC
jgi:hypothetical protein